MLNATTLGSTLGRQSAVAATAARPLISTLYDFLDSAPGDAVCDVCLAFACAVSLIEIREIIETFLRVEPEHFERAAICAGCGRTAPSIVYN